MKIPMTYEYDEDGNLSVMTQDSWWGVDSYTFYSYDEDGNLTSEEKDWDGDGMVDNMHIHMMNMEISRQRVKIMMEMAA